MPTANHLHDFTVNYSAGEASTEEQAAQEHDLSMRRDDVATQDAATHQQDNFE